MSRLSFRQFYRLWWRILFLIITCFWKIVCEKVFIIFWAAYLLFGMHNIRKACHWKVPYYMFLCMNIIIFFCITVDAKKEPVVFQSIKRLNKHTQWQPHYIFYCMLFVVRLKLSRGITYASCVIASFLFHINFFYRFKSKYVFHEKTDSLKIFKI